MGARGGAAEEVEEILLSWVPHVHRRTCSPGAAKEARARLREKHRSGQPAAKWTVVEDMLAKCSRGHYHPMQMRNRRRQRAPPSSEDTLSRPGVRELRDGRKEPCGRVTIVTPTTDQRHDFHEQLYAVFQAQDWADKELIVVETHRSQPSPFFIEKAKHDTSVVYHYMHIPETEQDLSIGLKRNIGTHLASGDWIASFDDDDLYAPTYLSTMLQEMVRQEAAAITLGSWYIFEERSGMFGYVDCRGLDGAKTDLLGNCKPSDRDGWLYGYGFSYMFSQDAASDYPFPDKNMGEDYDFFIRLKTRVQTALFFDDFGICVHTLHPRSTSSVQASHEVLKEEVQDLDVAQLGDLLRRYQERCPRRGNSSNIGFLRRSDERALNVHVLPVNLEVPLVRRLRCTVAEVKEAVAKAAGLEASVPLTLYSSADVAGTGLTNDERLGARVRELWAVLDPGDPLADGVGIRVLSADFESGNSAEFYIGGEKITFRTYRGMNVVTIDPETWRTSCNCYDIWSSPEALAKLIADLTALPTGHLVLAAIKDSGLEKLTPEALMALRKVGAKLQGGYPREGYALIGCKGGLAAAEQQGKGRSMVAVAIVPRKGLSPVAPLEEVMVECVDAGEEDVSVQVRVSVHARKFEVREALLQQHFSGTSPQKLRSMKLADRLPNGGFVGIDPSVSLGEVRTVCVCGLAEAKARFHA